MTGFVPPGEGWIVGPLFPPDLKKGPIETVRYEVAAIGSKDQQQIWHRPLKSPTWSQCRVCGAIVNDYAKHSAWHEATS